MLLNVTHTTLYRYDDAPQRSTQIIRLTPANSRRQRRLEWQVELPAPAPSFTDAFGNVSHLLCLEKPADDIVITARGRAEVQEREDDPGENGIAPAVFLCTTPLTEADEAMLEFVRPLRPLVKSRPFLGLNDLMQAVLEKMPYEKGATTARHTAAESFAEGRGVCQDHAHVFIACSRALGLPSRYVSGYVYSPGEEQVASHAWADTWIGNRWASFDVSNASGDERGAHLRLAVGRDYLDACPIRGVRLGGHNEALHTSAQVTAQE